LHDVFFVYVTTDYVNFFSYSILVVLVPIHSREVCFIQTIFCI